MSENIKKKVAKKTYKKENVTDGKVKTKSARSIDEVLGYSHNSTYKTLDANEYDTQIRNMAMVDLQDECIRLGIKPTRDRNALITRLNKEFRAHSATYVGALKTEENNKNNMMSKERRMKALDIMKAGK